MPPVDNASQDVCLFVCCLFKPLALHGFSGITLRVMLLRTEFVDRRVLPPGVGNALEPPVDAPLSHISAKFTLIIASCALEQCISVSISTSTKFVF